MKFIHHLSTVLRGTLQCNTLALVKRMSNVTSNKIFIVLNCLNFRRTKEGWVGWVKMSSGMHIGVNEDGETNYQVLQ